MTLDIYFDITCNPTLTIHVVASMNVNEQQRFTYKQEYFLYNHHQDPPLFRMEITQSMNVIAIFTK